MKNDQVHSEKSSVLDPSNRSLFELSDPITLMRGCCIQECTYTRVFEWFLKLVPEAALSIWEDIIRRDEDLWRKISFRKHEIFERPIYWREVIKLIIKSVLKVKILYIYIIMNRLRLIEPSFSLCDIPGVRKTLLKFLC